MKTKLEKGVSRVGKNKEQRTKKREQRAESLSCQVAKEREVRLPVKSSLTTSGSSR